MSDTTRPIRIVRVPCGDAPEWVRSAWVGLILPDYGPAQSGTSYHLLTGQSRHRESSHSVPMRLAPEILAAKSPGAAAWFVEQLGSGRIATDLFVFGGDECQPVTRQEVATLLGDQTNQPIVEWHPRSPDS